MTDLRKRTIIEDEGITRDDIITALLACNGVLSKAAIMLGMNRQTLSDNVKDDEEFDMVRKQAREALTDLAEDKLALAIEKGNLTATIFYLKTKGRDRGYSERRDLSVAIEQVMSNGDFRVQGKPKNQPIHSEDKIVEDIDVEAETIL